jgi:hypothetical protein
MDGDGTPTADIDVRVAQLQHALTSRIVIEQAKGMLAERYSLTPEGAYELIRLAARSNGIKVHAVSDSVLGDPRQTPQVILDLLETLPRSSFAPGRAVENVFRDVNESFLKLDHPSFICECADASCTEAVDVSAETMRSLHEDRNRYVIKPAHINTDLEELVEAHQDFVIVLKPASS